MTALEVAKKLIEAVHKKGGDFTLRVEGREIAFISSYASKDKKIPAIMCNPSISHGSRFGVGGLER
jgi:hypothetical protein